MIPALENLIDELSKLPTIGRKSAWRLALHLLEQPEDEILHLAKALSELKEKVITCTKCFNYSETEICTICSSQTRIKNIICVVEKPLDVFTIEKSGLYKGLYHVLGGVLSPINGITSDKLSISQLKQRIETEKPTELILGLGGSSDAETTSLYLSRIFTNTNISITRFARGLPAGTELEYIDQLTLTQALNERMPIHYSSEDVE